MVDDLSTGNRGQSRPGHQAVPARHPRCRPSSRSSTTSRPDVVDHHAAQSNVPASVARPGLRRQRQRARRPEPAAAGRRHGVQKFIYISSGGAMYGEPDPSDLPVTRPRPCDRCRPYGASKQALEAWLGVYQRTFGVDYTMLRYANIYGPRQGIREEGAVVAVFATRMAGDQPVTIDGTGQQTRDFVYVGDCVTANVAALERGSGRRVQHRHRPRDVDPRHLRRDGRSRRLRASSRSSARPRKGDVVRIVLDPGLAREQLGWRAGHAAASTGLTKTYKYFSDGPDVGPASRPPDTHVAILAGGEGTRLWPLSRSRRPKQLLQLSGERSLIQQTVDRLRPLVPPERILIVTEQLARRRPARAAARAAGLEHHRRADAARHGRGAAAGCAARARARARARRGRRCTRTRSSPTTTSSAARWRRRWRPPLGRVPGHDRHRAALRRRRATATSSAAQQLRQVAGLPAVSGGAVRRKARPGDGARRTSRSGDYLWNPGVFVWKNATLLDAFAQHQPDIYDALTSAPLDRHRPASTRARRARPSTSASWSAAPNVATIPARFGWSDIGSWAELWELSPARRRRQRRAGRAAGCSPPTARGNLVFAERPHRGAGRRGRPGGGRDRRRRVRLPARSRAGRQADRPATAAPTAPTELL